MAKINANIQSYTDQFVEEFKQSMEENGEGYEGLNISYDVVTDNDKLYSIKVSALQTAGDAVETNRYYHLDKTTGTELTLSNLFRSGSDYTTAISDEIRKQMKEQMEGIFWMRRTSRSGISGRSGRIRTSTSTVMENWSLPLTRQRWRLRPWDARNSSSPQKLSRIC